MYIPGILFCCTYESAGCLRLFLTSRNASCISPGCINTNGTTIPTTIASMQGMLTKLAWKEQGFLYRPPGQGEQQGQGGELPGGGVGQQQQQQQAEFGTGGGEEGEGGTERKSRMGVTATLFSSTSSSYSSRGTAQGTPYGTPRDGDGDGGGNGGWGDRDGRPGDHRYRKHSEYACFTTTSGDATMKGAGCHRLPSSRSPIAAVAA